MKVINMNEANLKTQNSAMIANGRKSFSTIQINKQNFFYFCYSVFVLAVIIEPDYIATTSLHLIFRLAKYVAACIVILFYIIRKSKLNSLLIGTVIFEGLLLLSTLINGTSKTSWLNDCGYVIVLILFAQTILEIDARTFFLSLSLVLGIYTHINTITRILFPQGMYTSSIGYRNCWFLGYDNCACMIILLAITVALFRIFYYKGRFLIWDWSIIFSGVWFIFVQKIATAIFTSIIFFVFIVISKIAWIRKNLFKGTAIVSGMIILFFLIQLVNISDDTIFLFIFKSLGRNSTFTGRTRIWSIAWNEIQDGIWFLGKGVQATATYQKHFGGLVWAHLHSYYLQIIYEGGFLAFVAFFVLLICVAKRFDKGKYGYVYMPFLAGFLSIMIMWQVEAYSDLVKYGFILLSLMYYTPLFVKNEETEKRKRIRLSFRPVKSIA